MVFVEYDCIPSAMPHQKGHFLHWKQVEETCEHTTATNACELLRPLCMPASSLTYEFPNDTPTGLHAISATGSCVHLQDNAHDISLSYGIGFDRKPFSHDDLVFSVDFSPALFSVRRE